MKLLFKLVFFLHISSGVAQISSDDLWPGDIFDSNIRYRIIGTTEEAVRRFGPTKVEDINFYKNLKLRGNVKTIMQKGYYSYQGITNSHFNFSINIFALNTNLLEKSNFNAEFNSNKQLIEIKLYQPQTPADKLNLSIKNFYENDLLQNSEIYHRTLDKSTFHTTTYQSVINYKYFKKLVIGKTTKKEEIFSTREKNKFAPPYEVIKLVYEYDNKSRKTKDLKFVQYPNETEERKKVIASYFYDEKGRLFKFHDDLFKLTFFYNASNKLKYIDAINQYPITIKYNTSGNISSKKQQQPNSASYNEIKYFYSENNVINTIIQTNYSDEDEYYKTTYSYNNHGDLTCEERVCKSIISNIIKPYKIDHIYKYDSNGNWIERKDYLAGELYAIVYHELSYY